MWIQTQINDLKFVLVKNKIKEALNFDYILFQISMLVELERFLIIDSIFENFFGYRLGLIE